MTEFESYSIIINIIGVSAAILIVVVAIWGEKIRQLWTKPKLNISLDTPNFNTTQAGIKGWYFLLRISNKKKSNPAKNVRLLLLRVYKKGPDGRWREKIFSGPTQVLWQWPQLSPLYATIGPDERATFARLYENKKEIELCCYWYPNNLEPTISDNDSTRIEFQAVSDTAESNILTVEIAWDGQWNEGRLEMQDHCVVKEITN